MLLSTIYLFSKIGALLGKFLSKGLQSLDIDDINLGPPGFQKAQDEIMGDLKLVYINIRFSGSLIVPTFFIPCAYN